MDPVVRRAGLLLVVAEGSGTWRTSWDRAWRVELPARDVPEYRAAAQGRVREGEQAVGPSGHDEGTAGEAAAGAGRASSSDAQARVRGWRGRERGVPGAGVSPAGTPPRRQLVLRRTRS